MGTKSDFRLGRFGQSWRTGLDYEVPKGVACHRGYEDPDVERHDSEHDQVAHADSNRVNRGLSNPCHHRIGGLFNNGPHRQSFLSKGQHKHKEECQYVHASGLVRPPTE